MLIDVNTAAILLKKGHVIAVKTDTVFGFIVLKEYSNNLYKLKKRNKNKKLIEFISKIPEGIDLKLKREMLKKWPGPTTYIYQKNCEFCSYRIPKSKQLHDLINLLGSSHLVSSSANISGKSACVSEKEFFKKFPKVPLLECDKYASSSNPSAIYIYSNKIFFKIRK